MRACLLDRNILLRMTKNDDPHYGVVRAALQALVMQGTRLCFTSRTLGEFWNASTRPLDQNGFGLSIAETNQTPNNLYLIYMRLSVPILAGFTLASLFVPALAASSTLVISQVYGGGGNNGATFKNDFIELLNISASPIDLNGYSVQYAPTTGSFSVSNLTVLPNFTLQPDQYFLVEEAAGLGGTTNLPAPDATGLINLSATAGEVALVNGNQAIGTCTDAEVVDLVGFGVGVNCSETAPAPALSNTTAALRNGGGCTDTDNNSADFAAGAPNPRNTLAT